MSKRLDHAPLTFHLLYESPLISVRDYRCRACQSGPGPEEHSHGNDIVLLRHGAFCKHFGSRRITADGNQADYFAQGSSYRVSHPGDCGDRGGTFAVAPRVLNDIIRQLDPDVDDHPEAPFRFVSGPCDTKSFRLHRELVLRLEAAGTHSLEHLWADVTALQLVAHLLEAAFECSSGPRKRRRRAGTDADHIERVEAAKAYLAARMLERLTLDEVAQSGAPHLFTSHAFSSSEPEFRFIAT